MQSCSGDDGNGGFWLMAGEAHISTIAMIMTTKRLTSAAFQSGFQRLKAELRQKLVERFPARPQEVLDSPSVIP